MEPISYTRVSKKASLIKANRSLETLRKGTISKDVKRVLYLALASEANGGIKHESVM